MNTAQAVAPTPAPVLSPAQIALLNLEGDFMLCQDGGYKVRNHRMRKKLDGIRYKIPYPVATQQLTPVIQYSGKFANALNHAIAMKANSGEDYVVVNTRTTEVLWSTNHLTREQCQGVKQA